MMSLNKYQLVETCFYSNAARFIAVYVEFLNQGMLSVQLMIGLMKDQHNLFDTRETIARLVLLNLT